MIVLGLLILLVVAAVAVTAIVRGGANVSLDLGSTTVTTDAAGMFLAGATATVLALIGLWLLRRGLRRARQRRREMRDLRDRAAGNEAVARREPAAPQSGGSTGSVGSHETRVDETRPDTDTDDHFDSTPRER